MFKIGNKSSSYDIALKYTELEEARSLEKYEMGTTERRDAITELDKLERLSLAKEKQAIELEIAQNNSKADISSKRADTVIKATGLALTTAYAYASLMFSATGHIIGENGFGGKMIASVFKIKV